MTEIIRNVSTSKGFPNALAMSTWNVIVSPPTDMPLMEVRLQLPDIQTNLFQTISERVYRERPIVVSSFQSLSFSPSSVIPVSSAKTIIMLLLYRLHGTVINRNVLYVRDTYYGVAT
jgi:hypothetical protein